MRILSSAALSIALASLLALATAAPVPPGPETGTIKGQIVFAGSDIPQPKELNVNVDQAVCLARGPVLDETWVIDPNTRALRNVFVWLAPADAGKKMPVPAPLPGGKPKPAEMDFVACALVPHSLALREGQPLVLKASSLCYNPSWHGSPLKNPGGNVVIPPGKAHTVNGLKADGAPIAVTCSLHRWAKAWVRVFDHPYYAVSDAAGRFEISNAPIGECRIVYWHDTGYKGGQTGKAGDRITVRPGVNDLGKVEWKQ
jgi:hypothetical protein